MNVAHRTFAASVLLVGACTEPTEQPPPTMRAQTVVLFATPKFISNFDDPSADIAHFYAHYAPLTTKAAETIVIFAVGNSDHILLYKGPDSWSESIDWARTTDHEPVRFDTLTYSLIADIVRELREQGSASGLSVKVYDQIDSGNEFTITNHFKYGVHPECVANEWHSFDVSAPMAADDLPYATRPAGVAAGTLCGDFLVDQAAAYLKDLGFDGILYDNQLGTRGRWLEELSPGFSTTERNAISAFFRYTEATLEAENLEVMWFDSYHKISVEAAAWSFPPDGYGRFDYLIASGFCVITTTDRYRDNLASKLTLRDRTKVIATLDYVDPWYSYTSMTEFQNESRALENIALEKKYEIDGFVFFANDPVGKLVPREIIESFAARFFSD